MPSTQSFIGVVVAVAGNITISLALNCQKLAHLRLQRESSPPEKQTDWPDCETRQDLRQADDQEVGDEGEDANAAGPQLVTSATRRIGKRSRDETASSSTTSSSGAASYTKQTLLDSEAASDNGERDGQDSSHRSQHQKPTSEDDNDEEEDDGGQDGADHGNESSSPGTQYLKSKLWWLGIALMTIGEGGNFISYGFAPASLVAPLGAVALLSNVIISPILLKERFKAADIGGILLAIIGAVTVVFSSKQSDDRLGPNALLAAIKRIEFVVYASISIGLGLFLAFLSRSRYADRWVLVDVGTCAIFGGFTVLSTKGISSLISGGQPIEALKYPITYVLVVVLAVTAVVQITYLNRALQRFDSREVIPTQFVLFTISAIVGSAILYRDFEDTDANRLINFLFGCLTTFAGVFVLTRKKDDENGGGRGEEDEGDEDEGEETEAAGERDRLMTRSWHGGDERGVRSTSRGRIAALPVEALPSSSNRKLVKIHTPNRLSPLPGRPGPLPAPSAMTTGSVPFSILAQSTSRQRSRTSSPSRFPTASGGGSQAPSEVARSAGTTTGILSTSIGLRTPRLGLINLDRPTGLSPGHYLLLATPPPPLNLNAAHQHHARPSSSYGSTGESAPLLLPMHQGDVVTPARLGKKRSTQSAGGFSPSPSSNRSPSGHRRVKSRASVLSNTVSSGGGDDEGSDNRDASGRSGDGSGKKRRTSDA
ncbi:uncharacterized protein PFL1_01638 [Pseudozyma flocculosa PF-1]|uniref:uncharacterized protein n=1 Tax=Pseudozyma flocculosa PF-1 TaxID=1277687 RepID=UPI000456068B|nr:uncharacterized protein PFL1_01638 [Pseudozyma flocculosa PF-1]EPQ30737.1 hypothetical protein PFL1_01638 [Pseudozyma flocculosa PF-1]